MGKKLLLVITKSNFGGAQRYVFDLATHLSSTYDVSVVFGGSGVLADKLKEAGIKTISLPSLSRDVSFTKDIRAFAEMYRTFKNEKPDIVHLNSSKAGAIGGLAARIAHVPKIIFTGHGWAFNEKRPAWQKAIIFGIHWLTIIFSHKTIAVSVKVKNDICRLPFVSKKIKIVRNGTSTINFLPAEKAREMLGLSGLLPQTLVIGTISELHKNKGLDIAIAGFSLFEKKHPESRFVIIGGGEEKEHLQKMTDELHLTEKIIFEGFIKDAATYLKAFDIFSLTSRTEAFPYVPLEAGLAGLPVITSRVGGLVEIIDNEKSGLLIEPENPAAFCEALEKITSTNSTRLEYAACLKEKIERDFSIEKMVKETTEVYSS